MDLSKEETNTKNKPHIALELETKAKSEPEVKHVKIGEDVETLDKFLSLLENQEKKFLPIKKSEDQGVLINKDKIVEILITNLDLTVTSDGIVVQSEPEGDQ